MSFDITSVAAFGDAMRLFGKADAAGWHERNGGNLSYRLTESESAALPAGIYAEEALPQGLCLPSLDGEAFLVTASGSFIGSIPRSPEESLCLIRICKGGSALEYICRPEGKRLTSELYCHLLAHSVRKSDCRVIYHAHPASLIALTFVLPLSDRAFSSALWRSISECALVFPEGIGALEWIVPGSRELALRSADEFAKYRLIVWAHHGVIAAGSDFDDVYSRVDTAEKSAQIYLSYSRFPVLSTITDEQLIAETAAYGLELNKSLL